jgi:hypothetical protein
LDVITGKYQPPVKPRCRIVAAFALEICRVEALRQAIGAQNLRVGLVFVFKLATIGRSDAGDSSPLVGFNRIIASPPISSSAR